MSDRTVGSANLPDDAEHSLKSNALRFVGTIANSIGLQAPSASVAFAPALMAAIVGTAGPFTFGVSVILMLFVAFAFSIFTRQFASAGSVYAFNGRALGSNYGFVSAWILSFVYLGFVCESTAITADFCQQLLDSAGIHNFPWPVIAVGLWGVAMLLAHRSVTVSSEIIFILEGVAVVLIAIVAVAVVVKGGHGGTGPSWTPLTNAGAGLSTIALGVVFAFSGFAGFEVAATFGEESAKATRMITAAIFGSLIVSGLIYTVFAWIETIAIPEKQLAASSVPLLDITRLYLNPTLAVIINIAIIISGYGATLAGVNGVTRLLFALSRDGFGARWLATTHKVHRSPSGALYLTAGLSMVGLIVLFHATAINATFEFATYAADLILVAYLLTVVAAFVWSLRHRSGAPPVISLAILAIGAIVLGYVIKNSVYPVPASPFNICMYLAGATIAAGIVVLAVSPSLRRQLASSPVFAGQTASAENSPAAESSR